MSKYNFYLLWPSQFNFLVFAEKVNFSFIQSKKGAFILPLWLRKREHNINIKKHYSLSDVLLYSSIHYWSVLKVSWDVWCFTTHCLILFPVFGIEPLVCHSLISMLFLYLKYPTLVAYWFSEKGNLTFNLFSRNSTTVISKWKFRATEQSSPSSRLFYFGWGRGPVWPGVFHCLHQFQIHVYMFLSV
jgi:hypothetical protein